MKIAIGDKVKRKDPRNHGVGEVVEMAENGRVRVLWEGDPKSFYSAHRPKRTWLQPSALAVLQQKEGSRATAYHPITKKMAQDLTRQQKPVYGEIDGQRYRIIRIGNLHCRTICGKRLDANRVKFDDGMSVRKNDE